MNSRLGEPYRSIGWVLTGLVLSLAVLFVTPTPTAAASPSFTPWWVQNFRTTDLWSGPSGPAVSYQTVPQWSYLEVVAPQTGPRLMVYVPWTKNYAYVDAASVGPSGAPPADWTLPTASPTPATTGGMVTTAAVAPGQTWQGQVAASEFIVRARPSVNAPVERTLPRGTVVHVTAWVSGTEVVPDNWTWAQLADGGYGYSAALQIIAPTTPPPPPANHPSGKWVDVNLLQQTAVAYEGNTPVHLAIVSSGSPGWTTPVGTHYIERRVADETMTSSSLTSLGLDAQKLAQANYDLTGVLFTQYFDGFGDALHDNYWLTPSQFGIPHSHGCVGMPKAQAQWFWNWATVGTPVVVQAK